MNRHVQTKHLAALHIEDFFRQTESRNYQWLLTYLDVFILIIMLVISLIALSEFENEEQFKKIQSQQIKLEKANSQATTFSQSFKTKKPPSIKKRTKTTTEDKKIQQEILTKPNVEQPPPRSPEKTTIFDHHVIKFYESNLKKENQLNDDALQKHLKTTVDQLGLKSVDIKVTLGYAQIEIQDKILFGSSEASLLKEGNRLLKKLIPLLVQSSGLIYIEGHTDNRPIKTSQFPSNWELGAARATSVLHYLTSQNIDSSRLRAITYGDTKPIADNSTDEGREKNRRVSLVIKILDNINDIPSH